MRLTPIGMVEGDVKMRSQRDEMEASMKTQTPHEHLILDQVPGVPQL